MKAVRILICCIAGVLISAGALFAQVSVDSGSFDVDVQVKRAIARGSDVCVDIVCTVRNSWNALVFQKNNRKDSIRIFDDEGGFYSECVFEVDGRQSTYQGWLNVAKDTPRKIRFIIKDVDEYAAGFALMELPYYGQGKVGGAMDCKLVIKDLPISR